MISVLCCAYTVFLSPLQVYLPKSTILFYLHLFKSIKSIQICLNLFDLRYSQRVRGNRLQGTESFFESKETSREDSRQRREGIEEGKGRCRETTRCSGNFWVAQHDVQSPAQLNSQPCNLYSALFAVQVSAALRIQLCAEENIQRGEGVEEGLLNRMNMQSWSWNPSTTHDYR